jgi:hypothetical protein
MGHFQPFMTWLIVYSQIPIRPQQKASKLIVKFYQDMRGPLHVIGTLFQACCLEPYRQYKGTYIQAMDRGATRELAVLGMACPLHLGCALQCTGKIDVQLDSSP